MSYCSEKQQARRLQKGHWLTHSAGTNRRCRPPADYSIYPFDILVALFSPYLTSIWMLNVLLLMGGAGHSQRLASSCPSAAPLARTPTPARSEGGDMKVTCRCTRVHGITAIYRLIEYPPRKLGRATANGPPKPANQISSRWRGNSVQRVATRGRLFVLVSI